MVFSLIALKAKERTSCFVPLIYYVLVLNVKGNICLQREDTEVLFRTGSTAEAVSSSLFFKKKKKTGKNSQLPSAVCLGCLFCTNTENRFNAGNWNYFNIFESIPICMSCRDVKCTWTVLLMLVCENMHFSINPFCTRLAVAARLGLWQVSACSPSSLNKVPEVVFAFSGLVRTPRCSTVQMCLGEASQHQQGTSHRLYPKRLHTQSAVKIRVWWLSIPPGTKH